MDGELDVVDFFITDQVLQGCAFLVACFAKPLGEASSVVEIGGFESESHEGYELHRGLAGPDPLPEPVPHRKFTDPVAQLLDVCPVQLQVPQLVPTDTEQALAKGWRRIRKGQDCPCHEFSGLQFVMEEGVQELRPPAWILQLVSLDRASGLLDDEQFRGPARTFDPNRPRWGYQPPIRRLGRIQLGSQLISLDEVKGPAFDGVVWPVGILCTVHHETI